MGRRARPATIQHGLSCLGKCCSYSTSFLSAAAIAAATRGWGSSTIDVCPIFGHLGRLSPWLLYPLFWWLNITADIICVCSLPYLLIWQPNSVSTSIWAAAAASRHAEAESQPKITEAAVAAVEMLFDIHLAVPLPPTTRSRNRNAKEMEIDGYPSSSSSTRVMGR